MSNGVKSNGDDLADALRSASAGLQDMPDTDAEVARYVANLSAKRAPKRTGRLARSIVGKSVNGLAEITANVPWAGPIHWGWPKHNIRANPFIAEVVTGDQAHIVDLYAQGVQDVLEGIDK